MCVPTGKKVASQKGHIILLQDLLPFHPIYDLLTLPNTFMSEEGMTHSKNACFTRKRT